MKILTFENMQSACTFCINQWKQKWHVRMGDAKHSKVASAYTGQSEPKLMALTRANDLLWFIHHFWLQIQLLSNFRGFPDSSVGKESACNAGDPRSIPGSERSAGEGIGYPLQYSWVSLVAQLVKNPPAMWETWVQSLGWEDPLEKGKGTHSSILAWRIPWTVLCMGSQRVGHDWATFIFTFPSITLGLNFLIGPLSNKLQCRDHLGTY